MTNERITTKVALLPAIEKSWTANNTAMVKFTVEQMTSLKDEQGWTVKYHLVHLTLWERSVVYFLQGKPRYEGLGIDETTYLNKTDDEINAVIMPKHQLLPLENVVESFRSTHEQLWALFQPLTNDDLLRLYRLYLPNEWDGEASRHQCHLWKHSPSLRRTIRMG